MYAAFVGQAAKEHKQSVADLFKFLSQSEGLRATTHARLLQQRGVTPVVVQEEPATVGNVKQTLKMAMSSENLQYYDLYLKAIKVAQTLGDTTALKQFMLADKIDERHRELINDALNSLDDNPKIAFSLCERCGYIFTGDRSAGCPVCQKYKDLIGMLPENSF